MTLSRAEIASELLRDKVRREVDAEYELWRRSWERDNHGKVTPGVRTRYFRERLVQLIFEAKMGRVPPEFDLRRESQ